MKELKEVKIMIPKDTTVLIATNSKFKVWVNNHAYLLVFLAILFVITWIIEVSVNVIWK